MKWRDSISNTAGIGDSYTLESPFGEIGFSFGGWDEHTKVKNIAIAVNNPTQDARESAIQLVDRITKSLENKGFEIKEGDSWDKKDTEKKFFRLFKLRPPEGASPDSQVIAVKTAVTSAIAKQEKEQLELLKERFAAILKRYGVDRMVAAQLVGEAARILRPDGVSRIGQSIHIEPAM